MENAARLAHLCEIIPPLIRQIHPQSFSEKPSSGKWSKKEILGHLIDSAANNHHRIVRGQFEDQPCIAYDQDKWNAHNYYSRIDAEQVILLWQTYNRQLADLMRLIPSELMSRKVRTGEKGEKELMSLKFLIEDYLDHLEYHLKQIVQY